MPKISALPPMTTADAADEAPIVDTSVGTTKKWTLTLLLSYLQSLTGWISNAMLANDTIKADKINWSVTGADNGIWWEELGRTTLSGASDSITVNNLPVRKYLRVLIFVTSTGGTINTGMRFNNDAANNYASRSSLNGGADGTGASTSLAGMAGTVAAAPKFITVDIINVLAQEKLLQSWCVEQNAAGAANIPIRAEAVNKWANTAAEITRIDLVDASGTGQYAIGSEVVILGHN